MRLRVNGVEIRVVDRIEVVLDVAEEGDTILHGVDIHIRGGPLTIHEGFCLRHDRLLTFLRDDGGTIFTGTLPLTLDDHGDARIIGGSIGRLADDQDALPCV